VAANGALSQGPANACERMQRTLSIAPAVAQRFELEASDGRSLCTVGEVGQTANLALVAPGSIGVDIAPDTNGITIRAGVIDGMATAIVPVQELKHGSRDAGGSVESLALSDGRRELPVFDAAPGTRSPMALSDWPL